MAAVILRKVEKIYDNGFKAVHGIDLDINDGEFMVFVGPSGCAKSTTLRMIAGLEDVSGGEIYISDRLVNTFRLKIAALQWCSRTMRCIPIRLYLTIWLLV